MTATIFNTKSQTCQGFVYRWTYTPTGEYYIGIHKGTPEDGYIGSGKLFRQRFNETYGNDWQREILHEGNYYKECVAIEKKIVTKELLQDPLCLNVTTGGRSGYYPSGYSSRKNNYRTKPQEVTIYGITYQTRLNACKTLKISFAELDQILVETGEILNCKYNHYNRY